MFFVPTPCGPRDRPPMAPQFNLDIVKQSRILFNSEAGAVTAPAHVIGEQRSMRCGEGMAWRGEGVACFTALLQGQSLILPSIPTPPLHSHTSLQWRCDSVEMYYT